MKTERPNSEARGISRREFVASGAFLGGCALLLERVARVQSQQPLTGGFAGADAEDRDAILHSVCLQCHTACPIKVQVREGVLRKIDGSPYSPQNMFVHLPYHTPPDEAAPVFGKLCPKGQAGIQTLYDPYRLRRVLKRAGPRGENRWRSIPFAQAIREIVRGGRLFADVPGEEDRHVPGLADHYAVRDVAVADHLATDAAAVASGSMPIEEFKRRHAARLDLLIDPDHPDLGPRNNRFVFLAGRIEHGRKEFSQRWLRDAFGSRNGFEHTTICEQSHHIAYQQMTRQWRDGSWTGGTTHMKPDARHAEFVLYVGTNPFEANFGPPIMAEKITEGLASGRLRIAVADPRFSKTASKAWKWLPVKPGTDAALALGLTRWIIEHRRYDERFLRAANRGAATAANETSWTDASWLVAIGDDGPLGYLRADTAGIGSANQLVTTVSGTPTPVDPGADEPVVGDLVVDGVVAGRRVKSVFQLLWEECAAKTVVQWADECGLAASDIEEVARELTAHGKRAAVEFYRGAVQHTNGYATAQAIIGLNLLIGNVDWRGGLMNGGGHWHELGDRRPGSFDMGRLHPGRIRTFGVPVTREGARYEESTLFASYPARRPWYPFTANVYQEVLPSAASRYPYGIGAVFLHKGTPGLSTPGANTQLAVLQDLEAVPLLFACDIVIGESSMYADYLFPDLSIWERWGTPHVTPDCPNTASKVRQPVVAPIPESVTVFGERMPISMEAVMLAIAEELDLPGYGPSGFGAGQPLTRPEDYYLRLVANIAAGDREGDEVPAADGPELQRFLRERNHLPPEVFDPDRWQRIVGATWWPRVVYVLNRGGRFEDFEGAYREDKVAHQFNGVIHFYAESVALTRNSMTGERFPGLATSLPATDALGRRLRDDELPFVAITYKDILGGQSRTISDYWLTAIESENYVVMNRAAARQRGFADGQLVRVVSASNREGRWNLGAAGQRDVVGKLKLTEAIRLDVIAVSWHFGHWAYGAGDVEVDGATIRGDGRRATGLCTNAVLRVDPHLGDVCLTDAVGGSASFYDTRVDVVPAER